jgi:hypothetical protein
MLKLLMSESITSDRRLVKVIKYLTAGSVRLFIMHSSQYLHFGISFQNKANIFMVITTADLVYA